MACTLCNRVAIVTGGAQGIGRGITRYLIGHTAGHASSGSYSLGSNDAPRWGVVVVDVNKEGLEEAQTLFSSQRVAFLAGDCTSEAVAKEALQLALKTFGRVDLLINNAGGGLPKVPLRGQSVDEFYEILHQNVGTAYVFSKVVGGYWEQEHERQKSVPADASTSSNTSTRPQSTNVDKAIVNISSTRALQSEHFSEPYAAGKGGVVALTHALASSLAHVARVNGINLGWIDVSGPSYGPGREAYHASKEDIGQHWSNKIGESDDVAHAVVFLYENYFMNGQCITLDGGMTKRMQYVE